MNTPTTPTPTTATTKPTAPSVLDKLLAIITTATTVAAAIPATSEYAQLALQIEEILNTAVKAHEQISGQGFDASKLQPIAPLP